jgi:hypothetical protein
MTANEILLTCHKLLYDIYEITARDVTELSFIMNSNHIKTIHEHYNYKTEITPIHIIRIMGHKVIHNEFLPNHVILLGYEKQIEQL